MSKEENHQVILNDVVQNNQGEKRSNDDNLKNISNDDYDDEQSNQEFGKKKKLDWLGFNEPICVM